MSTKHKLPVLFLTLLCTIIALNQQVSAAGAGNVHNAEVEDNEFAEFEDPDEPPTVGQPKPEQQQQKQQQQQKNSDSNSGQAKPAPAPAAPQPTDKDDDAATVQSEDDDFSYLEDKDEFEGFDNSKHAKGDKPDLKIVPIPVPLATNWDSYCLELITVTGLAVYFLNFIVGKSKNSKLANAWYNSHKELLESEFALVGDDGREKEASGGVLMRDSEHSYSLWCSGRQHVDGLLVELRFVKRQDLVSLIAKLFKPVGDHLLAKIVLDDSADWENFVLAVSPKKRSTQLIRDHAEMAQFCSDRRCQLDGKAMGLPDTLSVLAEEPEVAQSLIDRRAQAVLTQFEHSIDYLLISDMYTGPKAQQQQEEAANNTGASSSPTKLPDSERAIVLSLRFGRKLAGAASTEEMESFRPLFKLLLYIVDKMRKMRLSKEARMRVDKKRVKANEAAQRLVHSQRQEAAQLRREERRKAEKERLLNEEDPDRARKLEDREAKREAKRKAPKMKMLKVKGM